MADSEHPPRRLLFLCTANSERSPTAEDLFQGSRRYEAASAGLHPAARRKVSQDLVDWADMIFVMSEAEEGHATILEQSFDVGRTRVVSLEIPDRYPRGSSELVGLLKSRLSRHLRLEE